MLNYSGAAIPTKSQKGLRKRQMGEESCDQPIGGGKDGGKGGCPQFETHLILNSYNQY